MNKVLFPIQFRCIFICPICFLFLWDPGWVWRPNFPWCSEYCNLPSCWLLLFWSQPFTPALWNPLLLKRWTDTKSPTNSFTGTLNYWAYNSIFSVKHAGLSLITLATQCNFQISFFTEQGYWEWSLPLPHNCHSKRESWAPTPEGIMNQLRNRR